MPEANQCSQCGEALPEAGASCPSCASELAARSWARKTRTLNLILLFAVALCMVGAILVMTSSTPPGNRGLAGNLCFLVGAVIYVVARVILLLHQRRRLH